MSRDRRRRYYGGSSSMTLPQMVAILIAIILAGMISWFLFHPGIFSKIRVVVWHNFGFWLASCVGTGYAVYHKWKHPQEFTWLEFPFQIGVTFLSLFITYSLFFYAATDLKDKEIWNSSVLQAEYYEEWTEEVCETVCDATDEDGNCTSSHIECHDEYHPPEWKIVLSTGEILDISEANYNNYFNHFGRKHIFEDIVRFNQISYGDGNKYYVVCRVGVEEQISSATEHSFVNYLKGSQDTIRRRQSESQIIGFEKLLANYPRVHGGKFGRIEVDRVIVQGVKIPKDWQEAVDRKLDYTLSHLGSRKQVNALIYIVDTPDQSFTHALEYHWVNGKKNDVIVIIGAPNWPEVSWASVLAWTEVEEFKITLRNRILNLGSLQDKEAELVDIISSQISKSGEQGGFVRMPMAELAYLTSDVSLPWWAQILVLLIAGSLTWLTSWALSNNEIRDN